MGFFFTGTFFAPYLKLNVSAMFEYAKIKSDLEQIQCPVHAKTATVVYENGKMRFENVCCGEQLKALESALPDIEQQNVADIVGDFY